MLAEYWIFWFGHATIEHDGSCTLVWVPHALILLFSPAFPVELHLPWGTTARYSHVALKQLRKGKDHAAAWKIHSMPGSLAHRGEWRHKAPKLQLPWGTTVAYLTWNFGCQHFKFLIFQQKAKFFMKKYSDQLYYLYNTLCPNQR